MKILFLYTHNWDHEIANFRRGLVPTHRLWGYADVERLGHEALSCPKPALFARRLMQPDAWRFCQALHALVRQRHIDCIVAVHEACAMPALALKRLGLLRTPIVILNMALLHPSNCTGVKRRLWRWLLPAADAIVSLAKAHCGWVAEEFGLRPERQVFIPMMVDTDFFTPDASVPAGDFCLSVGTNDGKDFATLVKAFPRDEKLTVVTDQANADVIKKHADPAARLEVHQAVPIDKLRELYKAARLHIIPLADTRHGSGHTVLLENMALGKLLIVSASPSMRDYLEDGVNALAVAPHDIEALREKIAAVLAHPERFAHIGPQAAQWARRHFSSGEFARELMRIIENIPLGRTTPVPAHVKQPRPANEACPISR